jgi:carbon monoxide dehydrogenase subunit G
VNTTLVVIITLAVVLAGFLAFVASRPGAFRIERSAVIKARPETIFGFIDDFHHWAAWSPWEKIDPAMSRTYEGPASGVGAIYGWTSAKAGHGRMEVLEAPRPSKVLIKLDFLKPFEAHNRAIFDLVPEGDSTRVTWAMEGEQPFMGKLMSLVFNMEKAVGPDFEKGLAALKTAAEAA